MSPKKFAKLVCVVLLIGLITISTNYTVFDWAGGHFSKEAEQFYEERPFYVGVTYCGSSVQEAKQLIDKVKSYTNLFILQSGTMRSVAEVEKIGDYAVASNLSFAVYNSKRIYYITDPEVNTTANTWGNVIDERWGSIINEWANAAKSRWGERFIGIYYMDEMGGDMLDKYMTLEEVIYQTNGSSVTAPILDKGLRGEIGKYSYEYSEDETFSSSTAQKYFPDGQISTTQSHYERNITTNIITSITNWVDYYPDGTITINERITENKQGEVSLIDNFYTSENITKYQAPIQPYKELLKQNPIHNYDDAANAFVNMSKDRLESIDKNQLNKESILVFTADYGLYWWNYKAGYDVVLAELAWNHSITQEIGLVRGAATMQNKSWGTMITWKYTHPPYLSEGEEMFEQMKASYETGAEYVIIFNYSEDPTNPNTLQEEHFEALECFWNDVVQNSEVIHGGIKAEAVLVLPQNYGWGMRIPKDTIWGIWPADSTSQKIWNQLENKKEQYGLKIDIIFEDPQHPTTGKYDYIYYGNQTTPTNAIAIITLLTTAIIILLMIIKRTNKP